MVTTSSSGFPSAAGSGSRPRDRLATQVARRRRVGPVTGLLLALGFALIVAPTVTAQVWLGVRIEVNQPSPITVRVPPFAGAEDGPRGGGVVIARGEMATLGRAADAEAVLATQPSPRSALAAYFVIVFALAAIYAHHCRRSNRGRLLRVQVVNLGVIAAAAIAVKVLMLTTAVSVLVVPVALAAIVPTLVFDRTVGLATGTLAALVMSLVVPFDVGVAMILLAQASVAGLIVPDRQRAPTSAAMTGAVAGAIGAAVTYGIYVFITTGAGPWAELAQPEASPWVAALAGGVIALLTVAFAIPAYQILVNEITHGKLVALEDLAHPMLRQIATKAPGTWQHSLAMANMAELAANAIGANGRLVRVGAYFHDLGKSLQPKYFIENLEPGEVSPHEKLPPEVSCDAIFAHVTEGLIVARRAKLPERIVDFMHMHHGNGVLEYFWARCQEQGNPNGRTVEDFRYPGVPPQSRETAILAICDAVEAAARTLKRADDQAIGNLVQRIVYGKLHLGQLDDSGLAMADLRRISDSLRETIKHAHHGRIEYPWQKAENQDAVPTVATSGATTAPNAPRESTTQRLMREPRLDSLDAPRPAWQRHPTESTPPPVARTATATGTDPTLGVAATQPATPPAIHAAESDHEVAAPITTLTGRAAAPGSKPPAGRAAMTPSEAAIAVAPTFPPVDSLPSDPDPAGASPPAPLSPAATIATPSRVLAAVVAGPPIGTVPTTLPGVTTDQLMPPPLEARVTGKRTSQPRPAQADDDASYFPPPVEDAVSGDVIAARPRPEPGTPASPPSQPPTRPRRVKQQATLVDDAKPPVPPPAPQDSASTEPRMMAFRPSQVLPLPAPPASNPGIKPPPGGDAGPTSKWSRGLADRIDAAIEDEWSTNTPIHGPTASELATLQGKPDTTKLTPIDQIEQLVRESVSEDTADEDVPLFDGAPPPQMGRARTVPPMPPPGADGTGPRRRKRDTEEVLPEDVEASIDEFPHIPTRPGEAIVGPPPATRNTSTRLKRVKPPE